MNIKIFVLHLAIVASAGLLFVNLYNSIVDAPNWAHQLPQSLNAARSYFSFKDPSAFLKFAGPVIHIIGINCVIRFWRTDNKVRLYNITALGMILCTDLMTFLFLFPLNQVLFGSSQDVTIIEHAVQQWSLLNWLRSLILAGVTTMYSLSLSRYYRLVLQST